MVEFWILKILLDLISPPANTKETEVRRLEERFFFFNFSSVENVDFEEKDIPTRFYRNI